MTTPFFSGAEWTSLCVCTTWWWTSRWTPLAWLLWAVLLGAWWANNFCTFEGSVDWCGLYGNQYGRSSKELKLDLMWPRHPTLGNIPGERIIKLLIFPTDQCSENWSAPTVPLPLGWHKRPSSRVCLFCSCTCQTCLPMLRVVLK